MKYNVNHFSDWGYVHRALINGEWVELSRRETKPPFATVDANNITAALAEARRLYAQAAGGAGMIFVSEPGKCASTSFTGRVQGDGQ